MSRHLKRHLRSFCPHRLISCPHEDCGVSVQVRGVGIVGVCIGGRVRGVGVGEMD